MTQVTQYLTLPWTWDIREDVTEGCWIATIAELPDFFAAGENAGEVALNAREALLSHLTGYITSGTPIPTPPARTYDAARSGVNEVYAQMVTA